LAYKIEYVLSQGLSAGIGDYFSCVTIEKSGEIIKMAIKQPILLAKPTNFVQKKADMFPSRFFEDE